MIAPDVLAFADKKTDGAFAVTEPSGATVAWIRTSTWTGTSFEAFHASGEPLCCGARRGLVSRWWDACDPLDRPLASMRASFSGRHKQVRMADERLLSIQGKWFGRDWSLRDESGRNILSSEPTNSAWSFRPDAWVVRSHDASLDLACVVGIVELNRLVVKSARSAAASSSSSG